MISSGTTVVPELVTAEDIPRMGAFVKGAKTYAFQQFVPQDTLDKHFEGLKPYAPEVINEFAGSMKGYAENVVLRV